MVKVKTLEEFINQENKEKCNHCKTIMAVWVYMPSSKNGYYCDDCVPRGCGCTYHHTKPDDFHPPLDEGEKPEGIEGVDWKWVEKPKTEKMNAITKEDGLFVYLDDKGREDVCCEFEYSENGFDKFAQD